MMTTASAGETSLRAGPADAHGDRALIRTLVALGIGMVLGVGLLAGYYTLPTEAAATSRTSVLTVLWLNVILMIGAIVVEVRRRPFSLHLMHLLSLFLFFGVAGLCQYAIGNYALAGPVALMAPYNFTAAAVTSMWIISYLLTYEGIGYFSRGSPSGPVLRFLARPLTPVRALINLCGGFAMVGYLAALGLAGTFTRAGTEEAVTDYALRSGAPEYQGPFFIIHFFLLRAYPLVAFMAGLLVYTRFPGSRRNLLLCFALIALGAAILVGNNPVATYRMWLVTALFGLLAPYLFARLRTGAAVVLSTVSGLAILPSLGAGRHAETVAELVKYYLRLDSPLMYLSRSSDVDAMGMVTLCLKWLETHGHRWGLQTLVVIFCWVPRTLWRSKPIGTGAMVTGDLGFEFTNLSSPIVAEPLVDFGFAGLIAFAILLGVALSRLDRLYYSADAARDRAHPRIIDCIYPFWLGCVVFLTRGDLIGAATHTGAFTFWILAFGVGVRRPGRPRDRGLTGNAPSHAGGS